MFPLGPAPNVNLPFVRRIPPVSHSVTQLVITSTVGVLQCLVQLTLILPNHGFMAPKHKSSDAGNSDMPKTSRKVLSLSEKEQVLDLIRKEKNCMLRLLRPTVRTNLLSVKLWRRKKKFMLVLLLHLKLQKLQAQCVSASLRWKKALHLYNKIFWERERPCSHNFYYSILL